MKEPGDVLEETTTVVARDFRHLKEHVDKAESVAKLCNGVGIRAGVRKFVLARKISRAISTVRRDVRDFSTAHNLALTRDLHVKVTRLEKFEAMKNGVTQKDLEDMKCEVELKTKELEERDEELLTRDRASSDLELRYHLAQAELSSSKEALAAMEAKLEDQRMISTLASRVKVPPGAPRIRDWYVIREDVVAEACDHLCIGGSGDISEEPRVVGLAGPSGAGKSTAASMVIAREDVRASFHKGVLWLPVGQGAKDHLPELMIRLADIVYETALSNLCRPPRKAGVGPRKSGIGVDPEDGAAYIREVAGESRRHLLVVADDVWEEEVLEELTRAGVWVLYTTRQDELLPGGPLLRLDHVSPKEAAMVLRRAADLDDNAPLPEAAYDLVKRCDRVVLDLALAGRWSVVRGRKDGRAWQKAVGRILEAQKKGGEGGKPLPWRTAVLRAGLEELACDNPENKELYLALAVIPKGLAFSSEVAAVLLNGNDFTMKDRKAADGVAAVLERLSILTLEGSGQYRVHDDHADFVRGRFAANQDIQDRVLPPWREYISGIQVLLAYTSVWLVKIWEVFATLEGKGHVVRPYDAGLDAMDPSNTDRPAALRNARDFHWGREDWLEADTKNAQLLEIEPYAVGGNSVDAARTLHNIGACAKVKAPPGAPLIREWYVKREKVVAKACDRLGVGNKVYPYECPQMVGLAGPGGSGKSTLASMVVARDDVRVFFHKGVLWLRVGRGAKDRLPALMFELASTVWETVLMEAGTPPRESNFLISSEDGAAYIREVAGYTNRRFLVVADDVWDIEVLEELKKARAWVLYTTRDPSLSLEAPTLRLDRVHKEEAKVVLRRAAELDNNVPLPEAAADLMTRCNFAVKYLVMVGRLDEVRGRHDEGSWRAALDRILKAQKAGKGGQLLSWRAAVLRTGLGALASGNSRGEELYLALAVIPKGLAFPSEVARVLLYGHDCCPEDLEDVESLLGTLERLSILALEDSGWYHVHEDHVELVWDSLEANQDTRDAVLPRWRRYISSAKAINSYSSAWLVKVWEVLSELEGTGVVGSPYSAALGALRPDRDQLRHALKRAAEFHFCREDWSEAHSMYSELREIEEDAADGDNSLDVATILHNLGMCAYRVGKEEQTKVFLRRALAIQKEMLGANHPQVASTLHSLGVCFREAGQTGEAEVLLRQALEIRKGTPGGDPLTVARTLYSLGVCVCKEGRLEEAEDELLQEALVIREEILGSEHIEVANTLYRLGVCVHKAKRGQQAETHLRRALRIYEQKLGSNHPDLTDTLCCLGMCASEAGRPGEADEFFQRALDIREKTLGADHPSVAEIQKALLEV